MGCRSAVHDPGGRPLNHHLIEGGNQAGRVLGVVPYPGDAVEYWAGAKAVCACGGGGGSGGGADGAPHCCY